MVSNLGVTDECYSNRKFSFSCHQTVHEPACVACQSIQYTQSFYRSHLSLAKMGSSLTWQRTTDVPQQSDGQTTRHAVGKDLKEKQVMRKRHSNNCVCDRKNLDHKGHITMFDMLGRKCQNLNPQLKMTHRKW